MFIILLLDDRIEKMLVNIELYKTQDLKTIYQSLIAPLK